MVGRGEQVILGREVVFGYAERASMWPRITVHNSETTYMT